MKTKMILQFTLFSIVTLLATTASANSACEAGISATDAERIARLEVQMVVLQKDLVDAKAALRRLEIQDALNDERRAQNDRAWESFARWRDARETEITTLRLRQEQLRDRQDRTEEETDELEEVMAALANRMAEHEEEIKALGTALRQERTERLALLQDTNELRDEQVDQAREILLISARLTSLEKRLPKGVKLKQVETAIKEADSSMIGKGIKFLRENGWSIGCTVLEFLLKRPLACGPMSAMVAPKN